MLNDDELLEKCKTDEPITSEDLGIEALESDNGLSYELRGNPVSWLLKKLFGLED